MATRLHCRCDRCPIGSGTDRRLVGGRCARLDTETCNLRVGQCSFGPHKPERPGATPGPAIYMRPSTQTGKAVTLRVWRFCRFDSCLGHLHGPVVQWRRRLDDTQEIGSSILPGITQSWSVSVSAARFRGKEEGRVQFPDGPLNSINGPACRWGRLTLARSVRWVRLPCGPLNNGLIVQREDTALAWWESGFDSRSVH